MATAAQLRPTHITLPDRAASNRPKRRDDTDCRVVSDTSDADDSDGMLDDDIIGVSIGRGQDLMKSPRTPAAQKVQALEQSRSYFASTATASHGFFSEPIPEDNTSVETSSHVQPLTSGGKALQQTNAADDTTLDSDKTTDVEVPATRRRAASGSRLLDKLRRLIRTNAAREPTRRQPSIDDADSGITLVNPTADGNRNHKAVDAVKQTHTAGAKLGGQSVEAGKEFRGDLPTDRPRARRRATSDHSLYLKRRMTGDSEFDDLTVYADTSEMTNSRMKAIKDSFADSKFRITNVTNLKPSFLRNSPQVAPTDSIRSSEDSRALPGTLPNTSTKRTSKHPALKSALSMLTGDLVIMGGYRGSVLREAQFPNRQLWVPVKVGTNLRKADLELGLTHEDEIKAVEKIIPSGSLSHIGIIDIFRRLIRKCQKCSNAQSGKLRVHDWGYDWRVSPHLISDRLLEFLESLPCNQAGVPVGERGAWILAHSLGGMITRHVINRRPDLVAGVVFAGTPQSCANILGPLRNGDDVLFSARVLTAQVNFTLRTSYALLPLDGQCFINRETGERYDVDFFDAKSWDEYHLSPCIRRPKHRSEPAKKGRISGTLSTLSAKRSSVFGGDKENEDPTVRDNTSSSRSDLGDKVEATANAAKEAIPDGPLSPTLDGSSQHPRPSIATAVTLDRDQAYAYLERTLREVRIFKEELAHNNSFQDQNKYPPMSIIFSKNTPTVYAAKVASREDIKYDDVFNDLAFAAGDGVILASAAQLPHGYRCVRNGRVESERGHIGLLGDLEGVGRSLNALLKARSKGVGYGAYD